MRLLIADADVALCHFLRRGMEADGYEVCTAFDGSEAVAVFRNESPDLTILDLNLPMKDGERTLREMRAHSEELPILVLTARPEVQTRVWWLDHGADDLMTKPFNWSELQARCRVLLRRNQGLHLVLRAGDLELGRLDHRVHRAGRRIDLTNKEFALLEYLLLRRGRCISRSELLETIWKSEAAQTSNIVDVYVNYLRRKLGDELPGVLIRTVRGKGYVIPFESESSGLREDLVGAEQ